jgi:hypothetical protein
MKYLLTQKEYDDLKQVKSDIRLEATKKMQALCTKIADEMPIKWGWSKDEVAKPWGCIHSTTDEWYCDSCPVQDICPEQYMQWSK